MAEDKKKKGLSEDALARIKGIAAGGTGKQQGQGPKLPKFSAKAQGNAANNSSKRGMR